MIPLDRNLGNHHRMCVWSRLKIQWNQFSNCPSETSITISIGIHTQILKHMLLKLVMLTGSRREHNDSWIIGGKQCKLKTIAGHGYCVAVATVALRCRSTISMDLCLRYFQVANAPAERKDDRSFSLILFRCFAFRPDQPTIRFISQFTWKIYINFAHSVTAPIDDRVLTCAHWDHSTKTDFDWFETKNV